MDGESVVDPSPLAPNWRTLNDAIPWPTGFAPTSARVSSALAAAGATTAATLPLAIFNNCLRCIEVLLEF
jgi:hypothetical protein